MKAEPEYPHGADIPRARRDVAEICRSMYERGYIVARDGNVSVRIGDKRILATPSGGRKGHLRPEAMVLCDSSGAPVRGETGRPSAELAMHVEVYRSRPDVTAVVHAHPPCAIAHTVVGVPLSDPLMPEVLCDLGEILTIPYTTPTTEQVPRAIREPIRKHDVLLLERHGSITVGATLAEAYDRLEILEHAAKVSLMSRTLALGGRVTGLSEQQRSELATFLGCGVDA
jgi:L-fuculose-phosphate aldolase